ncbi:folate-binding protein YgfZ [Natronocella acetinitrilica]|uniref:Folate-binding protein YgfZ n=1 Tax=Natronocella acetinitrilica TaxID=414046 RepID=A0AAE3G5T3_9GAMM|nr:hypothetical protein [Natronocella acetinitrilica]MCP1675917.1 folate-binding protein YgfZ [Natronocella acetinitrilica]
MHPGWADLLHDNPSMTAPSGTTAVATQGHCPLPELGIILVRGADASTFLQSQLTQDIGSLTDGHAGFAGYCNPKGRLYALMTVVKVADAFILLTERGVIEPLLKRLRMFVLRSKVELDDMSDQYQAVAVFADRAAVLEESVGTLPTAAGTLTEAGDMLLLRWHDAETTVVLAHGEDAIGLWQTLEAAGPAVHPDAWRLLNISLGIPTVQAETIESFVPQQVNLERIHGVSFRKGCYPGQEVVARMHYLGKPSRRTYRLQGPGSEAPAAGVRVLTADDKPAGEVVSAARSGDGVELLAVLRKEFVDRQDLNVEGMPVSFQALPYTIEDDDAES